MSHEFWSLGKDVLGPVLVAGILFISQRINKHLSRIGAMPAALAEQAAAVNKLADVVKEFQTEWHDFKEKTEAAIEIHEERLDQHGRMLANHFQRINIIDTKIARNDR